MLNPYMSPMMLGNRLKMLAQNKLITHARKRLMPAEMV